MPYRKTAYRRKRPMTKGRRKALYGKKRRARRYNKITQNSIQGAGFPDRMFVKLKYVDNLALSGAGALNMVYRGNSVFDPDYTYTGHQPLYFDQYAAIYNKYRVRAVKQVLQIDNASTVANCNVTVVHSTSSSSFSSTQAMLEQTGAAVTRNIPISRQQSIVLKYFCKTTQAFGISKAELEDNDYSSLCSTNPTNTYYLHQHYESTDGVTACSVNVLVRMVYYVEFFDRKDIAQS